MLYEIGGLIYNCKTEFAAIKLANVLGKSFPRLLYPEPYVKPAGYMQPTPETFKDGTDFYAVTDHLTVTPLGPGVWLMNGKIKRCADGSEWAANDCVFLDRSVFAKDYKKRFMDWLSKVGHPSRLVLSMETWRNLHEGDFDYKEPFKYAKTFCGIPVFIGLDDAWSRT